MSGTDEWPRSSGLQAVAEQQQLQQDNDDLRRQLSDADFRLAEVKPPAVCSCVHSCILASVHLCVHVCGHGGCGYA